MKVCLKCHHLIDSTMNFCYKCGSSEFIEVTSDEKTGSTAESKPNGQPENQQTSSVGGTNGASQNPQNASSRPQYSNQTFTPKSYHFELYPMNWYKFLIYFLLWAGAVGNFVAGILYMNGGIYSLQTGGLVSAERIYKLYGGLEAIDIIFGLVLWAIAGYAIYTRKSLANYMSEGPKCLYIYYGVGAGVGLLYNILVSSVTGLNMFNIYTIIAIIWSVVIIVLNYKYFTKRDFLFFY